MIMNNKEHIFDSALKLFALHGYSGVTINMICEESSISKSVFTSHYSGKEEILDEILSRCNYILQTPRSVLEKESADSHSYSLQEILEKLIDEYLAVLNNPQDMLLWQVTTKEQFRNKKAGQIILEEISARIERLTNTFDRLQQEGKMNPCDSGLMASNYIYSIRALFQDCILSRLYALDSKEYIQRMYQTANMLAVLSTKN